MTMQSIQKPIRMGAQADWGELNTVRDVLNTLGLYDGQARGPMLDRELTDSIKTFQHGHGLKVDGIINPAGETENALFHVTTGHPSPRFEETRSTRKPSREGIGFGGHPSGVIVKNDAPQTPKPARKPPQKSARNLFDLSEGFRTGKRDDIPPIPERKELLTIQQRKDAILKNKNYGFKIVSNSNADGRKPWYAQNSLSQVKKNEKFIEREAKKADVDPNMVKAIVHLETTHGYYDAPLELIGVNKTIRPMNVHAKYWKDLGFSRESLNNPKKNIQAGIDLLKRIQNNMPNASQEKIATIYNNLGARKVSDYGARIGQILKEKPWMTPQ